MKRYRILNYIFDYLPNFAAHDYAQIEDEAARKLLEDNLAGVRQRLDAEFGTDSAEEKFQNLIALPALPASIVSWHIGYLLDARKSFISGRYRSSMATCCIAGEAILNELVIRMRGKQSSLSSWVKKDSFENWDACIAELVRWKVLFGDSETALKSLGKMRFRAVHPQWNSPIDNEEARRLCLGALESLHQVINWQYGIFGPQPWLVQAPGLTGVIKKSWEGHPYIEEFFLPHAYPVGPYHRLEMSPEGTGWIVRDQFPYMEVEISDVEWLEMHNAGPCATDGSTRVTGVGELGGA